jgi:hypothetical protein
MDEEEELDNDDIREKTVKFADEDREESSGHEDNDKDNDLNDNEGGDSHGLFINPLVLA